MATDRPGTTIGFYCVNTGQDQFRKARATSSGDLVASLLDLAFTFPYIREV